MADVTIKVIEPADDFALLTVDELKAALGISSIDPTQDDQLTELINRYSDVVATLCNRVFAKEKVRETWRCVGSDCPGTRLFLSHWPIQEADIESVAAPRSSVLDPASYELEEKSGKLTLFGAGASEIVVTYTGGFDLPDEAPPALKQACELLIRDARASAQRQHQAASGIRQLTHKEARVVFFDPATSERAQQLGSSSGINTAIYNLLMHFVRLQV
jgi:hypothetical protein